MIIGYARVSTQEQNLYRQLDNLKEAGCEKIFCEKMTGTKADRPELTEMLKMLKVRADQRKEHKDKSGEELECDTLVIDSFSRLSRSTKDLLDTVECLTAEGVNIISLKEQLNTTTASGKMMLTMLSALSQFERDLIVERTKDGLKAARARGRKGGRPKAGSVKAKAAAMAAYDSNAMTNKEIADQFGVSTATLSRWIGEHKDKQAIG